MAGQLIGHVENEDEKRLVEYARLKSMCGGGSNEGSDENEDIEEMEDLEGGAFVVGSDGSEDGDWSGSEGDPGYKARARGTSSDLDLDLASPMERSGSSGHAGSLGTSVLKALNSPRLP